MLDDIKKIAKRANRLKRIEHIIFNTSFWHVAWVDPYGVVVDCSEALCEKLGLTRDELIGKHFAGFTHPEDIDIDVAQYERLQRGEIDSYRIDRKRYKTYKNGEFTGKYFAAELEVWAVGDDLVIGTFKPLDE